MNGNIVYFFGKKINLSWISVTR